MSGSQIKKFLKQALINVKQPIQYLGNEMNAVTKSWATSRTKICLVYPDKYEVGMSNLAIQIFYDLINRHTRHLLERAFLPDDDMMTLLRQEHIPLFSLESKHSLQDFDMLAFSISTELAYTNVLLVIDLAGISKLSSERIGSEDQPLIIAGGGGIINPLPMSIFMDVIVIGDGEHLLEDISDMIYEMKHRQGLNKIELLTQLNQHPSLYVPMFHDLSKRIVRHHIRDFEAIPLLTHPIVPLLKVVHDRFSVEIMRGCPRKCRFCQASYISKPIRIKHKTQVMEQAKAIIQHTGYGELSLSSLSSSDYPGLIDLLHELHEICQAQHVAMSLPSLRVDSLSADISLMINKIRQSGVTLAPEAGSQFLRDVIHKDITRDDIFRTVKLASENSAKSIKLYIMIGLPREEHADIEAVVSMMFDLIEHIRPQRNKLIVNISNFVPKPYTPFQRVCQADRQELHEKLTYLKRHLRHPQLEMRWTDPELSVIEGILSRGDATVGKLILEAFRQGATFDAWYDHFDFKRWELAAEAMGVTLDSFLYHPERSEVPWEFVDVGISRESLEKDYELSMAVSRIDY